MSESERPSQLYNAGRTRVPVTHTGFLKKRGQRIKTWKKRYVVLELGRLSYFEKSTGTEEPPYGIGLKGSLSLRGYSVEDGPKDSMLMLTHKTDKREMLIEVENGPDDAANWRALLEHHIKFCNDNPTLGLRVDASFLDDEANRAVVANKFREDIKNRESSIIPFSSDEKADVDGGADDQRPVVMSAPVPFRLNPGFVIKSKRLDGRKVFVNVCSHDMVPCIDKNKNRKRWPLMVLCQSHKVSVDKHAEECHVFDVCVSTSVIEESDEDASGDVKESICMKVMDALIAKEKKDKVDYVIDKSVFSFPRLVKKYKGNDIAQFLIPRSIHEDSKVNSVFTAINVDDLAEYNDDEEEDQPLNSDYDPFATTIPSSVQSKNTPTPKAVKRNSVFYNSGIPKKFVTFNVERQTGAIIRERPEKSATRMKTLLQHTKTFCYGLYTDSNNVGWYRVLDGWTTARTDGGQRMLKAVCAEQPQSASITGANLVETEESGIFTTTKIQTLTYSIQLNFSRESILSLLRLQRSYSDFIALYNGLRDENRLQTDVGFPDYMQEDLVNGVEIDPNDLLELMDDLDLWLRRTIEDVAFDCGPSMRKFLAVSEADSKKLDIDLSAEGGLDGAWSMEID